MRICEGLGFNDVAVIPRMSEIRAEDVDLSLDLFPGKKILFPMLPSPMDTVIGLQLTKAVQCSGGCVTVPTHGRSIQSWRSEIVLPRSEVGLLGLLLPPDQRQIDHWIDAAGDDIDFVALDTLHFEPHRHADALKHLAATVGRLPVVSGNVVHADDASRVIDLGAKAVRVGMTSASINNGRATTGCGRKQLSAVIDCGIVCRAAQIPMISDGGVTSVADAFKALACGASAIMMGQIFAAIRESAAPIVEAGGIEYKRYLGMSRAGMLSDDQPIEGGCKLLAVSSSFSEFQANWMRSIRTAVSRAGAKSLKDLWTVVELERTYSFEG